MITAVLVDELCLRVPFSANGSQDGEKAPAEGILNRNSWSKDWDESLLSN